MKENTCDDTETKTESEIRTVFISSIFVYYKLVYSLIRLLYLHLELYLITGPCQQSSDLS